MQNKQPITLLIDGNPIPVNPNIINMSDHINELVALGAYEIPIPNISLETFKKVLEFCQINNYTPFVIPRVSSRNLYEIINKMNLKFIKNNFNPNNLALFEAATTLRINSLIKLFSSAFACKIYFPKDDKYEYRAKLEEIGGKDMRYRDWLRIRDEFPELNH